MNLRRTVASVGVASVLVMCLGIQPAQAASYDVAAYSANSASYAFGSYDYAKEADCQGEAPNTAYWARIYGLVYDKSVGDKYGAAVKATWKRCHATAGGIRWEPEEEVIGYQNPAYFDEEGRPVGREGRPYEEDWWDVKDLHFYTCNWNPATGGIGTCAKMTKQ